MERLTYFDNGRWRLQINGVEYAGFPFVDRLAAYEETGLEPEEIMGLQRAWDMYGGEEGITALLTEMPCYSPDTDVGCRRVVPYVDDEPIDRCKECPLCYSDKQRHRSEPNAPLTLAELREMDGEPVWGADGKYYIVNVEAGYASDKYRGFRMLWEDRFFFRRKPEEGMIESGRNKNGV